MLGFNYTALHKYLKILVNKGFTVVIVDQITPAPDPQRAVIGVYSAGTYINNIDSTESNNIISIYIEELEQPDKSIIMSIGLASCDLSTGECQTYVALQKKFY